MRKKALVYRECEQTDIDKLFSLLCSPKVMKYCCGPMDITGAQRWLDAVVAAYKTCGYDYWAVYEKSTGDFIGQMGILNIEICGKMEDSLAFMIDPKHWNRGFAKEGSIACIKHAFGRLGLEKLIATVEAENIQSIAVLTKIGMRYEGEIDFADKRVHKYFISMKDCPV